MPTHQPADPVPPIVCWHCGCQQAPGVMFGYAGDDTWICAPCSAQRVAMA